MLTSLYPVVLAKNTVGETKLGSFNESTPQTNLFWLENYEEPFVLLDEKDGALLVMSDNSWGEAAFDEHGGQRFVPGKEGNIAKWLEDNNPLPENLQKYILNISRLTEAGTDDGECPDEYAAESRFSLLSVTELIKYAPKIGISEVSESGWWLRSPEGKKGKVSDVMYCNPSGTITNTSAANKRDVRPIFSIDLNFVKNVKLDVEGMGTALKKVINRNFSKSELKSAGYSDLEINSIASGKPGTNETIEYIGPKADVGKINDINDNTFSLKFTVSGSGPPTYCVKYTVDGEEMQSKTLTVSGEGKYEFEVPKTYGKHDVNIKVYKGRKKVYDQTQVITYLKNYEKQFMQDFWRKGFATHMGFGYMYDLDLDYMEKAGIYYRRDEVPWNCMQYSRSEYTYLPQWWFANDELLERGHQNAAIAQAGNVFFLANGDVDGDAPHERWQLDGFAKYAHTMYTKKHAKFLEVWNEPNGRGFWKPEPNIEDYINLLKHTYSYVREQDPEIEIGSFVTAGTDTNFIVQGMELGAYPYSTAIVFHPYIYPDLPANNGLLKNTLNKVDKIVMNYGGWRDTAVTEIGWPTQYGGNSQEEQARAIIQNFVIGDDVGLRYNFAYDLKNDGTSVLDGEHQFGIYEHNMTPKKAYAAVSAYNCELEGALFHGSIDLGFGDKNSTYIYSKEKNPVIISWMNSGEGEYDFGSGAIVKDMYGNVISNDGKTVIGLDPIYVTNVSDDWFRKSAEQNITDKQNDWLKQYGGYFSAANVKKISKIFNDGASKLKNGGVSAESLRVCIDECFSAGELVKAEFRSGKMDNEKMSTVLFAIYKIAERYASYMMILDDATESFVADAEKAYENSESLANESHKKDGYTLIYTDNILRYAKRHIEDAKKVINESENPAKAGIISAWSYLGLKLCSWYDSLYTEEDASNLMINMLLDKSQKKVYYGEDKTFSLNIANFGKKDVKARIELYDQNNNLLGSGDESVIKGGGNVDMSVRGCIVRDGFDKNKTLIFKLIEDGKVIKTESYSIIVEDLVEVSLNSARKPISSLDEISFTLKNPFETNNTVKVEFSCPYIQLGFNEFTTTVPAGKTTVVNVNVKSAENTEYHYYPFYIKVYNEAGQLTSSITKLLDFWLAVKSENPIDVEKTSSIEDWKDAYPIYINSPDDPDKKEQWYNMDLGARTFVKWDEENLYFLTDVFDDKFTQMAVSSSIWQGDCVQVGIDSNNSGQYDLDANEIGAAKTPLGVQMYMWTSPFGSSELPSSWAEVTRSDNDNVTRYIMKMPKGQLASNNIHEDQIMGINVALNDADEFLRDYYAEYTQGTAVFKDSSFYAKFKLINKESVKMQNKAAGIIFPEVLNNAQTDSTAGDSSVFIDIAGHWAMTPVYELKKRGIVNGVSETEFAPEANITRAEFLSILTRMMGLSAEKADYSDVSENSWYFGSIGAAEKAGIINKHFVGENNEFNPDKAITREEIAVMLYDAAKLAYVDFPKYTEPLYKFGDTESISPYAKESLEAMYMSGILSGYDDNTIKPQSTATRAEASQMLYGYLNLL